jgi:hypothetical protein
VLAPDQISLLSALSPKRATSWPYASRQ